MTSQDETPTRQSATADSAPSGSATSGPTTSDARAQRPRTHQTRAERNRERARLLERLLATGRDVGGHTLTEGIGLGRNAVADVRSGVPVERVAADVIGGAADLASKWVEAAERYEVPGWERANQARRQAADIAAPLLGTAARSFSGQSEKDLRQDLRRRGQDLLHRSTAIDDPDEHPAFRRILDGLAPDEARIIRFMALKGPQAVMDVIEYEGMTRRSRELLHNVSLIGREAGCIRILLTPIYLDNLCRLGVVVIREYAVAGDEQYELLTAQPEIVGLPKPKGLLTRYRYLTRGVELTAFGQRLYELCFADADLPPRPKPVSEESNG